MAILAERPAATKHQGRELQQQRKNLLLAKEAEHHRYPANGCSGRNPCLLCALGRRGDVLRELRLCPRVV